MWILARSVPPPDLMFLLDMPGVVATQRKHERTQAQNEAERLEYLAPAAQMVLDAMSQRLSAFGADQGARPSSTANDQPGCYETSEAHGVPW